MSQYKSPSMLPLQLAGPPTMFENHLMSDENLSNLTLDEAVARINQLTAENAQLKTTVQQTNASMKMAVESLTQSQARTKRDEDEKLQFYNKSRAAVEDLKRNIAEKDRVIETLRKQIPEDPVMMQPSDEIKQLENENRKLMKEIDELKQKSTKQEFTLTSENNVLKMQLTTILTNHEAAKQNFLQEKTQIENKCLNLEGHLQKMQIEEQKKLEGLKMQNEKVNAELVNVSRKYEQLMSDYHDLLTSNDQQKNTQGSQAVQMKVDFESRVDNLTAQLVTAEEVLNQKQEQIRMLVQKLNDLEPLQAQVAIYKADFEAERRSREELNDRYLELAEKYQRLERSGNPHGHVPLAHVPLAHMPRLNIHPAGAAALSGAGPYVPRPPVVVDRIPGPVVSPIMNPQPLTLLRDPEPEQPDLKCPICSHICPDIDSLQLHVNECLESH